jgi:TPR repeat protein
MRSLRAFLLLPILALACGGELPTVPEDARNAARYHSCQAGDYKACVSLGQNYLRGIGIPASPERAIANFELACDNSYANGCRQAGLFWMKTHTISSRPDPEKASLLLQKACDADLAAACTDLAEAHERGPLSPDDERVASFYGKGCKAGDASACERLAGLFRMGRGVQVDHTEATELASRACNERRPQACVLAAESYFAGLGRPANAHQGMELLRQACAIGHAEACAALQNPQPRGGSAIATQRTWEQMRTCPAAENMFASVSASALLDPVRNFKTCYSSIDLGGTDPELASYITRWTDVSGSLLQLFEQDAKREHTRSDIENLSALGGALVEKNDDGGRSKESLSRGYSEGREAGRKFSDTAYAAADQESYQEGRRLGAIARKIADSEPALRLRLEMSYGVFLSPGNL